MYQEQEKIFYYITCMNENYVQPAMPPGREGRHPARHVPAAYRRPGQGARAAARFGHDTARGASPRPRCSRPTTASRRRLERDELQRAAPRRHGLRSLEHAASAETPRESYVTQSFVSRSGPFIAATDYMQIVADQIRPWVPGRYVVLGTDGYGRSDRRKALRDFFEVDRRHVVLATLKRAAGRGQRRCKDRAAGASKNSASIRINRTP